MVQAATHMSESVVPRPPSAPRPACPALTTPEACLTTATGCASPCLPCSHRSGDLPETVAPSRIAGSFDKAVVDGPIQCGNAQAAVLTNTTCPDEPSAGRRLWSLLASNITHTIPLSWATARRGEVCRPLECRPGSRRPVAGERGRKSVYGCLRPRLPLACQLFPCLNRL